MGDRKAMLVPAALSLGLSIASFWTQRTRASRPCDFRLIAGSAFARTFCSLLQSSAPSAMNIPENPWWEGGAVIGRWTRLRQGGIGMEPRALLLTMEHWRGLPYKSQLPFFANL